MMIDYEAKGLLNVHDTMILKVVDSEHESFFNVLDVHDISS